MCKYCVDGEVKADDRHGGGWGWGIVKENVRIEMAQQLWFLKFKISWIFQNLVWSSKSQTLYLSNIDSRVLFIGPKSSKKSLCTGCFFLHWYPPTKYGKPWLGESTLT